MEQKVGCKCSLGSKVLGQPQPHRCYSCNKERPDWAGAGVDSQKQDGSRGEPRHRLSILQEDRILAVKKKK